jgi:hypothetical protein
LQPELLPHRQLLDIAMSWHGLLERGLTLVRPVALALRPNMQIDLLEPSCGRDFASLRNPQHRQLALHLAS